MVRVSSVKHVRSWVQKSMKLVFAAVRGKSKARVKYITDNTYFVFVRDTDMMEGGDLWIISIGAFYYELVGF